MKTLKVKSILFSLLAMMAVAVFMTSCEQESIIDDDVEGLGLSAAHDGTTDEVIEPPLTLEELDAIWKEAEQSEGNNVEARTNCGCSRFYASRRSNTSSYLYCQRYQDNSVGDVTYRIYDEDARIFKQKYARHYYVTFKNLIPGNRHWSKAFLNCTDGDQYQATTYYFTQNGYYPPAN